VEEPAEKNYMPQNETVFTIGRPKDSEAALYYFTYINQVKSEDPLSALESQLQECLTLFSTISEERSLHRYASDKWDIRQVLNHVSDTERVTAFRAFWFARGFESSLPSYDQHVAVASAGADRISWETHVEEFRRVRLATISLFRNMPPESWEKSGIASDNHFTVRALAYIVVGHCQHHLGLLRTRYL
jgi:DinB superfamily